LHSLCKGGATKIVFGICDENQQYMKMTKDAILEGSSQQAKKDFITRKNGQGLKHLKFFLLVFSKDEAQDQEAQAQPMRSKAKH